MTTELANSTNLEGTITASTFTNSPLWTVYEHPQTTAAEGYTITGTTEDYSQTYITGDLVIAAGDTNAMSAARMQYIYIDGTNSGIGAERYPFIYQDVNGVETVNLRSFNATNYLARMTEKETEVLLATMSAKMRIAYFEIKKHLIAGVLVVERKYTDLLFALLGLIGFVQNFNNIGYEKQHLFSIVTGLVTTDETFVKTLYKIAFNEIEEEIL